MKVEVKLVVFFNKEYYGKEAYCCYCPALRAFYTDKTFNVCVDYIRGRLIRELEHRIHYKNLKILGWEVSENSAKPPIFADEDAVLLTERSYEVKIKEPIIIKVDVELPKSRKRW